MDPALADKLINLVVTSPAALGWVVVWFLWRQLTEERAQSSKQRDQMLAAMQSGTAVLTELTTLVRGLAR